MLLEPVRASSRRRKSLSGRLLALVEGEAIVEADASQSAGAVRLLLKEGVRVLTNELDGLVLPFDRGGEIADFGTGGGERVEAVGVAPVGELACSLRLGEGPIAIAIMCITAGRQDRARD